MPTPIVDPAEHTSEIALETAATSPLPEMTPPVAVDQIIAEAPEAPVTPPILAAAPRPTAPQHEAADLGRETMVALANGVEALSEEIAGLARRSIETAARTAIEMLAVKTVADAIAVNANFARASFGNWAGSSAKLSELSLRLAAESSRPFSERLGRNRIEVGGANR